MQRKHLVRTTALLCAALGAYALTLAQNAAPDSPREAAKLGSAAPDFKLKDTFGKEFTLSEFKGRPVVLEWINQDCPVSRGAHEKSKMQDVYKKYADKGVIWLGVDSTYNMTAERNRVYAARMGLAYPILMDTDGQVGRLFQAKRTPHMFVIDKSGTLVYDGAIDDKKDQNYVAAALDDLLAGRTVSKPKTDAYGCGIKYAPAR
ncbi:MAG TPA: redoxin domain-containing protein [Phycisphaerae bacterium]|nr:redoxin domain-containing protein [Phycisphaerae bacterium]HOJ74969.1 redoxin domain-containing protein [Phycisphaerae bacterium]HOM51530.1 redoxin domain-containing protein [Phycisphaerae bacterium]HON67301.1 redoxin domain-containing protein [Phycisphaerae bacterium]HOQ87075.1 redoxin domain-containing protein [Phycisphaerae bacterium]